MGMPSSQRIHLAKIEILDEAPTTILELSRSFQSPPVRSDQQSHWLCWNPTPALLTLSVDHHELDSEQRETGKFCLDIRQKRFEIRISTDLNEYPYPEFHLEIRDDEFL